MLRRGRPARARGGATVRELTSDDVEVLETGKRASLPAVSRLRDSHHMCARLFARGLRHQAVAKATGYSYSRIAILYGDPAFQELIAQYRSMVDEEFREGVDEYLTLATSNMLKAERMLSDKLDKADEEDDTLPTRDLIAISRDAADRFGYGKKNVNFNVNADFATMLEKAMERSSKVISGEASKPAPPSPHTTRKGPVLLDASPPLRRRA